MNIKLICPLVLTLIVLTGCATRKSLKILDYKDATLAHTDMKIPLVSKNLKVSADDVRITDEKLDEVMVDNNEDDDNSTSSTDDDIDKQLLAKNVESLIPELFIDGVAIPDPANSKVREFFYLEGAEELHLQNNYFDIPVVYNSKVKKWIDYFTKNGRKYFTSYVERAGRYAPMIGGILEENGLPRDLIFLAMAESGFNNHAVSWASAAGPWQFMPSTGRHYSLNQNWFIDERKDPIKATIAAAQYLSKLYEDFGEWEVATAAYNAGEGKLGRAIKKYKTKDFWKLSKGRFLKNETKNYMMTSAPR